MTLIDWCATDPSIISVSCRKVAHQNVYYVVVAPTREEMVSAIIEGTPVTLSYERSECIRLEVASQPEAKNSKVIVKSCLELDVVKMLPEQVDMGYRFSSYQEHGDFHMTIPFVGDALVNLDDTYIIYKGARHSDMLYELTKLVKSVTVKDLLDESLKQVNRVVGNGPRAEADRDNKVILRAPLLYMHQELVRNGLGDCPLDLTTAGIFEDLLVTCLYSRFGAIRRIYYSKLVYPDGYNDIGWPALHAECAYIHSIDAWRKTLNDACKQSDKLSTISTKMREVCVNSLFGAMHV